MHGSNSMDLRHVLLFAGGLAAVACSDSLLPELPPLVVTASIGADTVLTGDSVTLSAALGDGQSADTVIWLERPGDIEVGQGLSIRARLATAGTHEFVVRAATADGRTGRDSVTAVALANGAPVFTTVTAPARGYATDTLWLVATASDPESSTVRLTWTSDRAGLLGEGDSLPWLPGNAMAGTHVVTVAAADPQGTRRDSTLTMSALSTERFLWSRTVPKSQATNGDVLALGDDGTVFAGFQSGQLLTFSADGTPGWEFPTGANLFDHSTGLTIAPDGRVFVFNFQGNGYGLTATGGMIWQAQILGRDPHGRFTLGPDGSLFAAGNDQQPGTNAWLRRLDPATGQVLWEVGGGGYASGPALTADGTLSVQLFPATLIVDTNGTVLRDDTLVAPLGSNFVAHYMSAVDAQGTAYFPSASGLLSAVRTDGSLAWQTQLLNRVGEPVIAADGTVFTTTTTSSSGGTGVAYAFGPDGSVKWQTPLAGYSWIPRLALLSDGTLWVALGWYLYRLSASTGALVETLEFAFPITSALAVDEAGVVYVTEGVQRVVAVQGPAPLEPNAPWPIWRRDNRRTASVPRP
jgi:hypothetical protein